MGSRFAELCLVLLAALAGCGEGSDRGASRADAADADADTDTDEGTDTGADADAGSDETSSGEVVIEHMSLTGYTMGESILIVGPEASVLVDAAGEGLAPRVLDAVDRRLGERAVDWLVITHFHNDHIGAIEDLFEPSAANGNDPLVVERGVVTRGLFDIGSDMVAVEDFVELCGVLTGAALTGKRIDLCSGPSEMPCGGGGTWPADACDGLLEGDLERKDDDGQGRTSYIRLGKGARLYFYQADGYVAVDGAVLSAADQGVSIGTGLTAPENARSLGALVRFGDFDYGFNGDTPGDGPKMEGFIASHGDGIRIAPGGARLFPDGGADVMHASHHGLATATTQDWVDWLFPDDGRSRNAVVGTTSIYVTSPSQAMLDRVGPHLGEGFVWTTVLGLTHGDHDRLRNAKGAVVVRATAKSGSYTVAAWRDGAEADAATFPCTPDGE